MKIFKIFSLFVFLIFMITACGGSNTNNTSSNNQSDSQASAPATATPFPTFAFVPPTNPPVFNQSAESTEEADASDNLIELDPKMVERGLGRYEALDCASCHGEAGIGTDETAGFLDFAMTQDDFITFMRSGGEIGNDHQYSTDRLSENGARNLYQYLVSIAQGE